MLELLVGPAATDPRVEKAPARAPAGADGVPDPAATGCRVEKAAEELGDFAKGVKVLGVLAGTSAEAAGVLNSFAGTATTGAGTVRNFTGAEVEEGPARVAPAVAPAVPRSGHGEACGLSSRTALRQPPPLGLRAVASRTYHSITGG